MPLLLVLLSGCPRHGPPPSGGVHARSFVFPASSTPWGRHPGFDACFPTTPPNGWSFGGTRHYQNLAGLDLSWSYGDDSGTVLTVYVYPQHGPAPKGMSLAEAETRASGAEVDDVTWGVMGPVPPVFGEPGFMLGGLQQRPLASLLPQEMWPELAQKLGVPSLDGVTRTVGTLVIVWAADPWFVKMRATWLDEKRAADDVIPDLLGWSVLPCASLRTAEGSLPMLDVPPEDLPAQPP